MQSLSRKDLSICLKNFDHNVKSQPKEEEMMDGQSDIEIEPSKYDGNIFKYIIIMFSVNYYKIN